MMIHIDGSQGEGGGQILRTSLALSLLTNQPFEMVNIRLKRQPPGLRPQHLASVKAAAAISKAEVEGATPGSIRLVFRPGEMHAGRYEFNIATAGSTCLVLQTIYLPLSKAASASNITITGGTHAPKSPSFEYLDQHWLKTLRLLGYDIHLDLIEAGFYPQGGGKIQARIRPTPQTLGLNLSQRGLDRRIAERQRNQVIHRLGDSYRLNDIRISELPSRFKGTFLLLLAEFEHSQACFFSLGALGKPAERVADEAVDALVEFLATDGAIDAYLADQLLLPLAYASSGSQLRTSRVSNHLLTNASVINTFHPNCIQIRGSYGEPGDIIIHPR
jgi:RNA 3'-phosphate cyclase